MRLSLGDPHIRGDWVGTDQVLPCSLGPIAESALLNRDGCVKVIGARIKLAAVYKYAKTSAPAGVNDAMWNCCGPRRRENETTEGPPSSTRRMVGPVRRKSFANPTRGQQFRLDGMPYSPREPFSPLLRRYLLPASRRGGGGSGRAPTSPVGLLMDETGGLSTS